MVTTERQNAAERAILAELRRAGHFQAVDTMLVRVCACVWVEMEALQKFVNANGTVYTVVGRSGDVYNKHRPEHQQLVEARGRLLTIFRELGMSPTARKRVQIQIDERDEIAELRELAQ